MHTHSFSACLKIVAHYEFGTVGFFNSKSRTNSIIIQRTNYLSAWHLKLNITVLVMKLYSFFFQGSIHIIYSININCIWLNKSHLYCKGSYLTLSTKKKSGGPWWKKFCNSYTCVYIFQLKCAQNPIFIKTHVFMMLSNFAWFILRYVKEKVTFI